MSDVRFARVGDVIAHGETIPANVVLLRDQDGDLWRRGGKEQFGCLTDNTGTALVDASGWWPVKVVEVDPEPQPAEPKCCGMKAVHLDDCPVGPASESPADSAIIDELVAALHVEPDQIVAEVEALRAALYEARQPAEPGPLALTLPEVPAGAVALYGLRTGTRYKADPDGVWRVNSWDGDLADVLRREHPEGVTVEFAPPPEPRTWPKLDPAPEDVVAFRGASGVVYRHASDGYWYPESPGRGQHLLSHWREVDGPLTEVLP